MVTPKVIVYKNPKDFWFEISPHLKIEEAKNSLILGISFLFLSDPKNCIYQSAFFDGSNFLGSLSCSQHRQSMNLLPSPVNNSSHAKTLFDEFLKSNINLTGIVAETKKAEIYKSTIDSLGLKTRLNMSQGIYKCSKVLIPATKDKINFRLADIKDLKTIGEWIVDFHREAVPHDPPVNGEVEAKVRIGNEMIYVLEKENQLLSMAAWSRDLKSSCSINLVFTPEKYRKKGYASLVTALLTQHMLLQGKKGTKLYTDTKNPTSNKIYQQIGYEFVCNSLHIGLV